MYPIRVVDLATQTPLDAAIVQLSDDRWLVSTNHSLPQDSAIEIHAPEEIWLAEVIGRVSEPAALVVRVRHRLKHSDICHFQLKFRSVAARR